MRTPARFSVSRFARLFAVLAVLSFAAAACGSSEPSDVAADNADNADNAGTESDVAAEEQEVITESPIPDNPVLGTSLSQFSDPANDDAVGQPAPDLDAVSLKGDRIEITQADGRGKIFGFFAHWCPHCQAEVPLLVDYLETNRLPVNVDFHAVSTAVDDSRDNYPPIDWFDAEDWPFPVLDDSQLSAIAAGFGLSAFPYFVVVDGDGNVVQRIAGGLPDESAISQLIALAEGS